MSFQRKNQVLARPGRGPSLRPSGPIARPGLATLPEKPSNPGVKPSIITSQPTISSGAADLDRQLGHGGVALGTSVLVEETGATDYALVLLKYFASQGVVHNRLGDSKLHSHVIVVGENPHLWAKDLPGVYKGSRKEAKKNAVLKQESKLSVQNVINPSVRNPRSSDLKIAWRYGLKQSPSSSEDAANISQTYPNYNHTFDITSRLVPAPSPQDITFLQLPLTAGANQLATLDLVKQVESIVQVHSKQNRVVRLVIPSLLNPLVYPPELYDPSQIVPFLHMIKGLLVRYSSCLTLFASISLDLFAQDPEDPLNTKSPLVAMIERLFDSVFQLVPFKQSLYKLLETSYKNQPNKIQQGFFNILKVHGLSEKGTMAVKMNEYAFRNGKRNFEISGWSIPVDGDEVDEKTKQAHDVAPEQTTKNIDF